MSDQFGDRVAGLEPGGGVAPGDTPPTAGQTSQALSDHQPGDSKSSVNAGRGPAIIAIGAISLMVIGVLVYVIASIVGHLSD